MPYLSILKLWACETFTGHAENDSIWRRIGLFISTIGLAAAIFEADDACESFLPAANHSLV